MPAALSNQQTLTVFGHIPMVSPVPWSITRVPTGTLIVRLYRAYLYSRGLHRFDRALPERFFKTIIDKRVQVLVGFHHTSPPSPPSPPSGPPFGIYFRGGSSRNHYRHHLQRPESMLINKLHFILRKSFACAGLRYTVVCLRNPPQIR